MFNEYLIFFKITWVKLREKNGKIGIKLIKLAYQNKNRLVKINYKFVRKKVTKQVFFCHTSL